MSDPVAVLSLVLEFGLVVTGTRRSGLPSATAQDELG